MTSFTMEMLYILLAFMVFMAAMIALAVSERQARDSIREEKRMAAAMDRLFNRKEAT